jgi:hypothetical protein
MKRVKKEKVWIVRWEKVMDWDTLPRPLLKRTSVEIIEVPRALIQDLRHFYGLQVNPNSGLPEKWSRTYAAPRSGDQPETRTEIGLRFFTSKEEAQADKAARKAEYAASPLW